MINDDGIYDQTGKEEKTINSLNEISGIEKYYDLINNFHNYIVEEKDLANNQIKKTLEKYIDEMDQIILPGAGFDLITLKFTKEKKVK